MGAAQTCWPLGVQAFHSPMKLHRSQKAATCASPAALEQQASWGRPHFGTQMQLCVGMSRDLSVDITFLLSNRAEKPVSRPPGPCCTLECAVPSRPGGQQPKKMYAASSCRMDRLARRPGGMRLVAARQIVQHTQRSCAHAWCSALWGPRGGRQRAEGCG